VCGFRLCAEHDAKYVNAISHLYQEKAPASRAYDCGASALAAFSNSSAFGNRPAPIQPIVNTAGPDTEATGELVDAPTDLTQNCAELGSVHELSRSRPCATMPLSAQSRPARAYRSADGP
jgi:hypothetical protein